MEERRRAYLRAALRGTKARWAMVIGTAFFLFEAATIHSWRLAVWGIAFTAVAIFVVAYMSAHKRAATEFFAELAAELGLNYTERGSYMPMTPLLAAGDRQLFTHAMQGPLFGQAGGPQCILGHYTYSDARQVGEDATVYLPHRFTVCAIDIGMPLWRFRGLYLRPRVSAIGADHDWLARAPRPEAIKLESARFNELYDLRRASDQDESAVRELFSPSLVAWLSEHPLQPGFECKAGTLAVFIRGHEESGGKIRMLHEAARELVQRLAQQVEEGDSAESPHFSAAGQMIR
jgi:hypothetical protein